VWPVDPLQDGVRTGASGCRALQALSSFGWPGGLPVWSGHVANPGESLCVALETLKWVLGLVGGPGWVMVGASFRSHAVPRPHTRSNAPHVPQAYRGPSAFRPPSLSDSVADTGEGEADGASAGLRGQLLWCLGLPSLLSGMFDFSTLPRGREHGSPPPPRSAGQDVVHLPQGPRGTK
jgi:hypothetical protein